MSQSSNANASLGLLSSEAISLLEQAKRYKAAMDALPEGDPRRPVYDNIIRDLLERSRRLSSVVVTTSTTSSS
jgi:hypothetical protein